MFCQLAWVQYLFTKKLNCEIVTQMHPYSAKGMGTLYLGCTSVTASPALQQHAFASSAVLSSQLICLEAQEYYVF